MNSDHKLISFIALVGAFIFLVSEVVSCERARMEKATELRQVSENK